MQTVLRKLISIFLGSILARRVVNLDRLQQVVAESEQHHTGEIAVAVESRLSPFNTSSSRERAYDKFSELRVWDTAENTGVLLFISLPEHKIELVVDRGLVARAPSDLWEKICIEASQRLRRKETLQNTIEWAVRELGKEMRELIPGEKVNNQLSDRSSIA